MKWKTAAQMLMTFTPSRLRIFCLRLLGAKIERNVSISPLSIIVAEDIVIDRGTKVSPLAAIVGVNELRLGERTTISSLTLIGGRGGFFSTESQVFIAIGCVIETMGGIKIGARTQIGPGSYIYSHAGCNLSFNMSYPYKIEDVEIGRDCWISMRNTILSGVRIGDRVVVPPGLVVRKSIASDSFLYPSAQEYKSMPVEHVMNRRASEATNQLRLEELKKSLADHFLINIKTQSERFECLISGPKRIAFIVASDIKDLEDNVWNNNIPTDAEIYAVSLSKATADKLVGLDGVFLLGSLSYAGINSGYSEEICNLLAEKHGIFISTAR